MGAKCVSLSKIAAETEMKFRNDVEEILTRLFAIRYPDRNAHAEARALLDVLPSVGLALAPKAATDAMNDAARDWSYKKYGKPIGADASEGCYAVMIEAATRVKP